MVERLMTSRQAGFRDKRISSESNASTTRFLLRNLRGNILGQGHELLLPRPECQHSRASTYTNEACTVALRLLR
jgi:hypothetical protein